MWILSILLGLAVTGNLMANPEEDLRQCMENIDIENLEKILNKGESQLEVACPLFLDLVDCIEDVVVKVTGLRLADLAEMAPTIQIAKGAKLLVNLRDVVSDVCTDGSELNRAYRENAACLEKANVDDETCASTALAVFEAYKEFEDAVQEEAGEDSREDNKDCMVQAYKSACIAAQVYDECGQSGFDVYQTIIKRTGLFSVALCSQEDLQTLKTRFLDSLNLEGDQRDLFQLAFDLRKRRK